MKKIIYLIISTILVFFIVSCGDNNSDHKVKDNNFKDETISSETSSENETKKENKNSWGIELTTENVTPTSLTLVCTQSGGSPTGDLETGSFYFIEEKVEDKWLAVEMIPSKYDIAWTEVAWIILMNETIKWEVNWKDIYGELSDGNYRIGKKVHDFRKTADYDEKIYYGDFEIKN